MVTKQIIVNGLNVRFDKIKLHYDIYMIWYKNEIVSTIHEKDIKKFKHKRTLTSELTNIEKLVIFTMEWGD